MVKKYMTTEGGRRVRQKYADILRMSRPEPPADHPRMSLQNRAKIFSPFAALRGYEEEIADQNRVHELIEKKKSPTRIRLHCPTSYSNASAASL